MTDQLNALHSGNLKHIHKGISIHSELSGDFVVIKLLYSVLRNVVSDLIR